MPAIPPGTFAFVFPTDHSVRTRVGESPQLSTEYDADDMSMTVSLAIDQENTQSVLDTPNLVSGIVWDKASETVQHRLASNAFGVKSVVRYSNAHNYGLAFPLRFRSRVGAEVSFALASTKAKLVKNRLRVLVVCAVSDSDPVLGSDAVFNIESSGTATIDSPYDWHDTNTYLYVIPSAFWVFDNETPAAGSKPEMLCGGQIRSFKLAKVDREARKIELDLV